MKLKNFVKDESYHLNSCKKKTFAPGVNMICVILLVVLNARVEEMSDMIG